MQINYALVLAMDALMSTHPYHAYEGATDYDGSYQTDCIDLTDYSLAMMVLSDDAGFDGVRGSWFPTYSGVIEISSDEDRTCVPDAPDSWAIPTELVHHLSGIPGLQEIISSGFVVVFIVDHYLRPVAGARLMKAGDPPEELRVTVYPNADFTDFGGTETSENGFVFVPGPMGLTNVIATKPGMTWESGPIGVVEGTCFTRPLIAED